MKRSGPLLAILVAAVRMATAGVCANTTLDQYIALGSGGCSIGNNTIFGFQELLGQAGAVQIAPGNILVTTSGGNLNPTIQFTTSLTVSSPVFDEALITYQIKGNPYMGEATILAGTSATGFGDAASVQNYCLNGTFSANGVTGCPGDPSGTHNVLVNFGNGSAPVAFSPNASSVSITDDFVLDASGGGSATGGSLSDSFNATPEPGSYVLAGLGVITGLSLKRVQPVRLRLPEVKNE